MLPIETVIPDILEGLKSSNTVILRASPGAGKTTGVPPALLSLFAKQILVLEPRRIAAKLSAERIAELMGEKAGETVGYHIRFEQKASEKTRIKFITEGLFLRYLLRDSKLSQVDCIILDEFHERHIHSDVTLALVKQLQESVNPNLKLIVMSATLNTEHLSQYLPQAKVVTSEVAQYPVDVCYLAKTRGIEDDVLRGVEKVLQHEKNTGHILIFLPGQKDIQRCSVALEAIARKNNCEILSLYGSKPLAEQQRVFIEIGRRKIILSTNVAETSVTIPGVTAVVDSGLAKVSGFAAWSGMPTLDLKKVSQASCIQRAGRAGRTAPGVCLRLMSENDYFSLQPFEKPEIVRSDLSHLILELASLAKKLGDERFLVGELLFLDALPIKNKETAMQTLNMLGTLKNGEITPLGEKMVQSSLHPRLSRLVLEGIRLEEGPAACLVAAMISENTVLEKGKPGRHAHSDFEASIESFFEGRGRQGEGQSFKVTELCKQIARQFDVNLNDNFTQNCAEKIAMACLYAFPDRVAQKKKDYVLCQGGGAILSKRSAVESAEYIIVIDADESSTKSAAQAVSINMACALEVEQILDDPGHFLKETEEMTWDGTAQRVRSSKKLCYGNLVIEERALHEWTPAQSEYLAKMLKTSWPKPFEDDSVLTAYHQRVKFIQQHSPNVKFPLFEGESFNEWIAKICDGKKSFAEILENSLQDYIEKYVSTEQMRLLEKLLPSTIKVGSGRNVKINYEPDKPPWIGSRMQDFFGTLKTPTILDGKVRLVVHLLGPNLRPIQVTTDLESFWSTVYPKVRGELSRRYPRHFWPEDPKNAEPPALKPARKR